MLSEAKKRLQNCIRKILNQNKEKGVPPANARKTNEEVSPESNTPEKSGASSPTTWMCTWASQPLDKLKVHGFESQILSLKKMLGDRENEEQFKVVGVVGARGTGKSTLCQVYYYGDDLLTPNEKTGDEKKEILVAGRQSTSFFPRVWLGMSKQSMETKEKILTRSLEKLGVAEREKILTRILEKLGVAERITKEKSVSSESGQSYVNHKKVKELLYALRLQLIGKKYLIVLDDVVEDSWYNNLFEAAKFPTNSSSGRSLDDRLACGLPQESGGTVIATSREEKNVKGMVKECHDIYCVLPLSNPHSLSAIFEDTIAKLSGEKDQERNRNQLLERLEKITSTKRQLFGEKIDTMTVLREKVVSKCNGIPLAARLIAETMFEQLKVKEEQLKMEEEQLKMKEEQLKKKNDDVAKGSEENGRDQGDSSTNYEMEEKRDDSKNVDEKKDEAKNKTEKPRDQEDESHERQATSKNKENDKKEERVDKETSQNKEENHSEEGVAKKDEPAEIDEKIGEQAISLKREDIKDVETEKFLDENKQVQREDIHEEKTLPKKEDDQKTKETKCQAIPTKNDVDHEENKEASEELIEKSSSQTEEEAQAHVEASMKKLQEMPEKS